MPAIAAPDTGIAGERGLPFARQRVVIVYAWRHGRLPDLDNPRRFTERVQVRKLCEREAWQTRLMDKIGAKRFAASLLGEEWIVPSLWSGTALPAHMPFAAPAIVKARHGCNQYQAVPREPRAAEWLNLRKRSAGWQRSAYGRWLDEWAYRDVPRGLLAEPLLGGALPLPVDYKIYVFGGQATHVQVHLGRGARHRWILHDRDWKQLVPGPDIPAPPQSLPAMLAAAETLARDTAFLRVDFYEVDGKPWFGEFCLYPGSGLDPFAADWIDFELGALWRAAEPVPAVPKKWPARMSPASGFAGGTG